MRLKCPTTTIYRKGRAKVVYHVTPKQPYRIRNITYFFHDATLCIHGAWPTPLPANSGRENCLTWMYCSRKGSGLKTFCAIVAIMLLIVITSIMRSTVHWVVTRWISPWESAIFRKRTTGANHVHKDHPVYTIRDVYMVTDFDAISMRGQ